jgi:glycerophosphoryl diester phosphodiesterase
LNAQAILKSRGVAVIAHRGYSRAAPENTLPAFQAALDAGAIVVELDYVHSADGVPVVFHDEMLDRTTNAREMWGKPGARVSGHTLADLKTLDAGKWFAPRFEGTAIPGLREAVELICERGCGMIERKSGDAATCVRLLESTGFLAAALVCAFDWDYLRACRKESAELVLGALGEGPMSRERLADAKALGAMLAGWKEADVTREGIAAAHSLGLSIWCWTVDDVAEARQLAQWGADGLISNDPATMLADRARHPREWECDRATK